MNPYTEKQLQDTLKVVEASIVNCEKISPKLKEGSPQLSLNTNRLKALHLAKELLEKRELTYTKDQLEKAITQITSIKNKSTTGIRSAKEGSGTYTRFSRIISAMDIVLEYLQEADR